MAHDDPASLSLRDLAQQAGLPPRTIRYYISRDLLAGPLVAGRHASYSQEHLDRLHEIRTLQQRGLTLSAISGLLGGAEQNDELPEPTTWQRYQIAADVTVLLRSGAEPWRIKQIRSAMKQFADRLAVEDGGG